MLKANLHVFLSDFKHESRVLRETKSIVNSGLMYRNGSNSFFGFKLERVW